MDTPNQRHQTYRDTSPSSREAILLVSAHIASAASVCRQVQHTWHCNELPTRTAANVASASGVLECLAGSLLTAPRTRVWAGPPTVLADS